MTTAIYKAQIDTPYGLFLVAVKSIKIDARSDILSAAYAEFPVSGGMLRIRDKVKKSNRRIISEMHPIKKTRTTTDGIDGYWAWIKNQKGRSQWINSNS